MKHLIRNYASTVRKFEHVPLAHPVIMLIDNDDGAKDIFAIVKINGGPTITLASTDLFYFLGLNLYLVKTPEIGGAHESRIEDLFDPALLKTIVDGKTFDPSKPHGAAGKYGKIVFAEKMVRPNAGTIDFSKFAGLRRRAGSPCCQQSRFPVGSSDLNAEPSRGSTTLRFAKQANSSGLPVEGRPRQVRKVPQPRP